MNIHAHPRDFSTLCQETYHRFGLGEEARKHILRQAEAGGPRGLPHRISAWRLLDLPDVFFWAQEIGGLCPNQTFTYPNAQGSYSTAITCSINGVPRLKNPFVVAHHGLVTAPLYALDVIRYYAKKYHELLPFIAIGKHNVIFDKLYNRNSGIICKSEANAYYNIMSMLAPESYARKYQKATEANFYVDNIEGLYYFAKAQGLDEISLILCSGQSSSDKAILSRWMYMLKDDKFADIKINLALVICPMWLKGNTPDNYQSEISLSRQACNIGEMMQDTITFDGQTKSSSPKRYSLQSTAKSYFKAFEYIIKNYNCFGHPLHSHELYGTNFKDAVEEVFKACLWADASFVPEDYENGIKIDIAEYKSIVGRFTGKTEDDFLKWCIASPEINFWAR